MKKQLNTEGITNELAGASLFFSRQKRTAQNPVADPSLPEKPLKNSSPVPVPEPVPVGVPLPIPLIPKVKRVIRQRQPFDIYQDQYERLKKIAEEEKDFVNGRGISQMVRKAIDNYLKDHGTPRE